MNIMAEMTLPKRDMESVSAGIEIEDITELMFGTVLERCRGESYLEMRHRINK